MLDHFTVCVLHYGDYPLLAERMMRPFCRPLWSDLDIRIGANAISPATRAIITEARQSLPMSRLIDSPTNLFKYPMMRRLFGLAPLRKYVMWFDDDSCLLPTAKADWFKLVADQLRKPTMLGSIWMKRVSPEQRRFYQQQTWYRGKAIPTRVRFITGGWWALPSDIIQRFDWPPVDMIHNGGDMTLGELLRQNDIPLKSFSEHVAINADNSLKCSSAKRRGASQAEYGTDKWKDLHAAHD